MNKYKKLFEKVPYKQIRYEEFINTLSHKLNFILKKGKIGESSIYEDIYHILQKYHIINANNIKHVEKDFFNLIDQYVKKLNETAKSLNQFRHYIISDLMKIIQTDDM